jgi:hypothetical protein
MINSCCAGLLCNLNDIQKALRCDVFKISDTSCQSSKLENFHLKFIYRISYKIAKRQAPEKRICPIENCRYAIEIKMSDILQIFEVIDIFT